VGVRELLQGKQPKATLRRRGARQACLALLSGTILFFVLQIAAAFAIEIWHPSAIDPDYAARFQRIPQGRSADREPPRTVVMLGSSRTYYGLEAERLHAPLSRQSGRPVSVVNFGFTGAGPMTELLTWRRLQRDGVRPGLVLIEVLPPYLSSTFSVDDTREDAMPTDRLDWNDMALLQSLGVDRTRPGLRWEVLENLAVALYSRRLPILIGLAPRLIYPKWSKNPLAERRAPNAFPTQLSRQVRDQARNRECTGYTPFLKDFHLGGRNCEALRELLASCRREGVPTALVLMPEGPVFRSLYPPETWRQIQDWLERLGSEEGAPLVNAREWIDEDDFVDSHHLLPQGAEKFTDRLGREYILPLLESTSRDRKGVGEPSPLPNGRGS
jgi:hypothetical protein